MIIILVSIRHSFRLILVKNFRLPLLFIKLITGSVQIIFYLFISSLLLLFFFLENTKRQCSTESEVFRIIFITFQKGGIHHLGNRTQVSKSNRDKWLSFNAKPTRVKVVYSMTQSWLLKISLSGDSKLMHSVKSFSLIRIKIITPGS